MAEAAEKTPVAMTDGRVAHFNKRQKLVKTATFNDETGEVKVVLDFLNGETRTFLSPPSLILKLAAHGAAQKLGDEIANEADIEDAVIAMDDLLARLHAGDWNTKREAGAFAGTSVLLRALVEASGKSVEAAKAFLAPLTLKQKVALRLTDKLRPIIQRIEAEKGAKAKTTVDTSSLLADFGLGDPVSSNDVDDDADIDFGEEHVSIAK